MTHKPKNAPLADEPIEVRRKAEEARRKEIDEGLTRQHLAIAEDERYRTAVALSRVPDLGAKMRKD